MFKVANWVIEIEEDISTLRGYNLLRGHVPLYYEAIYLININESPKVIEIGANQTIATQSNYTLGFFVYESMEQSDV